MKKEKLNFLLAIILIIVYSCSQKDKYPPIIYLKGDNPMYVTLGKWFKDPGADADDNKDGPAIVNKIVRTHNIPIQGPPNGEGITIKANDPTKPNTDYFTVNYSVKDNAGNESKAIRKVYVYSSIWRFHTRYEVKIDAKKINPTIIKDTSGVIIDLTTDQKVNYRLWFPKFLLKLGFRVYGDFEYNSNLKTYFINIPEQAKSFTENNERRLYVVKGILNESIVEDTISPVFNIKYNVYRYKFHSVGTQAPPGDYKVWNDTIWRIIDDDIITEYYEYYY